MVFWSLDQKVGVDWMSGWMHTLYTSMTSRAPVVLLEILNIQTLPKKLILLLCTWTIFLVASTISTISVLHHFNRPTLPKLWEIQSLAENVAAACWEGL